MVLYMCTEFQILTLSGSVLKEHDGCSIVLTYIYKMLICEYGMKI